MNVTSEIKSYIELKETCGALLLTGKWGCGKSYIKWRRPICCSDCFIVWSAEH